MKSLIPLAILIAFATADARAATPQVNHGVSPLALASGQETDRSARGASDNDDIVPDSDHPGWLRDRDHAGWGWSGRHVETVMGLYKRNPDPDFLPNADIIQGGHGAAGLAVSFKLGG